MNEVAEKLVIARELVESVLSGECTYETHPESFNSGSIRWAVNMLELHAPELLLAKIRDRRYSLEARGAVVGQTLRMLPVLGDILDEEHNSE